MEKPAYLYELDDRPPFFRALIYGLQWAFITFPVVIIATTLASAALKLDPEASIRFLRLTFLTTGLFTFIQTLWGHRFPLIEGPSTALILTFLLLVPYGLPAIQGGTILGGLLVVVIVLTRQLEKLIKLFTPNVVGVILMLIAFGLLSPILKFITGTSEVHPQGEAATTIFSLALVLFIATLSYRLTGFWKTVSTLIGMIVGSLFFVVVGRLNPENLASATWISLGVQWLESVPGFYWPAVFAFGCSYIAVIVNSLGSLQGVAAITDQERLPGATRKGIFINGLSGIFCGLLGVFGTVSYSMSPGVILSNRVASRYAMTYCGGILVLAVFLPKLAALLALVPAPVVGAVLCVALGGQIGAGIAIVASKELTSRDYFVVGVPTFLGALAGFFPSEIFSSLPGFIQVFLGNSLIVGIVAVLLLEHVLCRERSPGR